MNRVTTPVGLCRFGLQRTDITPPRGIYHRMWGAATHDRAEGVHRPLTATAAVFRPRSPAAGGCQILVAIDHCMLLRPEMDALADRISSDHGVSRDRLAINFSHTHGAGLMDPEFTGAPGADLIRPYLEEMAVKISGAVGEALSNTREGTLTYTTGRCSLAKNRDYWDRERGMFVCGFNPTGPADDTVAVVRVTAASGAPVAVLVNYACHPTTLAWKNRLISPDFPGTTREVVETTTGVPCIFLQGASGDIGPQRGYCGDPEVAETNGRQLGYAALEAWESLPPPETCMVYTGPVISGATLGTWDDVPLTERERKAAASWGQKEIALNLPYRAGLPQKEELEADLGRWTKARQAAGEAGNDAGARDAHAQIERVRRWLGRVATLPAGEAYPYRIHLWRVGGGVWVALQGEPYNVLQRALRERFPGVPVIVSVLSAGGFPLYLPQRETYGRGIYQEEVALLERGALERVMAAVEDGIEKLLGTTGDRQP